MTEARKATDHKARPPQFGARYECSCGWSSSTWWGKGARSNAAAEFRFHKDSHIRRELADRLALT